jgi:hypothetical protein
LIGQMHASLVITFLSSRCAFHSLKHYSVVYGLQIADIVFLLKI